MNRPTPISIFFDQRPTKSITSSRTSCGTQFSVRVPQGFFLTRCVPPSAPPGPRPWSAPSSPRTQSASVSPPPGGEDAPAFGRRPLHSRRTLFASGRTPSAAAPVPHTDRKLAPCLKDGAAEPPPSPLQCSACALSSYVRSAILTDERSLHFHLRRNTRSTPLLAANDLLMESDCAGSCGKVAQPPTSIGELACRVNIFGKKSDSVSGGLP